MLKHAMIEFAAVTDVGRVRNENQDRWFADAELGLFVVADGLGGHAAGALAAQLAVDILPRLVRRTLSALATTTTTTMGTWCPTCCPPSPKDRRVGPASGHHVLMVGERRPTRIENGAEGTAHTPGPSPASGRGEFIAEQVKVLSDLVYKETHGQPGIDGTGTTLALALVDSAQVTIVHAGDSRAYLLRQGELQQVTQDHTLEQFLVKNL